MKKLKRFLYRKPNGDESRRVVWVLNAPSEDYLCLDLTQFTEDEQEVMIKELEEIQFEFEATIADMGLSSCFRKFKEERIL